MRVGSRLLFRSGLRSLIRHPARTLLIVSCTALGVAAMIGTFAVNEQVLGAFDAVRRAGSGGAPLKVTGSAGVPADLVEVVDEVDGVRGAIPVASALVPIVGGGGALMIVGVDPDQRDLWLSRVGHPDLEVRPGLLVGLQPSILIDRRGADRIGCSIGEIVKIVGPKGVQPLRVAGTFDAGPLSDASGGFIAVSTRMTASILAGTPGVVDRIEILLDEGVSPDVVLPRVADAIPDNLSVVPGDLVTTGAEQGFAALGPGLLLAGFTAVLAGAFLVHNVHALSIAERRPQLGSARALGATRRQVLGPLALEGLVLGGVGSLLGIPLGHGVALGAVSRTFDDLPLVGAPGMPEPRLPEWPLVGLSVGVGLAATAAAVAMLAIPAVREAPALAVRRRLEPRPEAPGWWTHALAIGFAATAVGMTVLAAWGLAGGYAGIGLLGLGFGVMGPVLARATLPLIAKLVRRRVTARLAIQDLERHPRRVGLTFAALGLAAAMAVQSAGIIGSFQTDLLDWMDGALIGDLWIASGSSRIARGRNAPLDADFIDGLRTVDGVRSARGARGIFVPIDGRWIYVVGIDFAEYFREARLIWHEGGPDTAVEPVRAGEGVLVSDNYAVLHDVHVGDAVTIPGPDGDYTLPVAGVVTDWSWGQGTILLERRVLAERHGMDTVDMMSVTLEDGADHETVRQAILARWGESHALHVMNAEMFNESVEDQAAGLFEFAASQKYVVMVIAFLSVLNTVALSVMARRRELALLMAVGASPARLRRIVVFEGACLAVLGTVMGLAVGLAITVILLSDVLPRTAGWRLDLVVPWLTVCVVLVGALVTGAIAGLLGLRLAGRPTAAVLGDRA